MCISSPSIPPPPPPPPPPPGMPEETALTFGRPAVRKSKARRRAGGGGLASLTIPRPTVSVPSGGGGSAGNY